jgi:hypothetical protein
MSKMSSIGKDNIGLTYKVNLPRLYKIIKETAEYGEPMENFIKGRLGVHDGNYRNYYFPDFFIYNYDDNYGGEYWLSNGNRVIGGNLSLLLSAGIISEPEIKLENKLIAEEFLQNRDTPIVNLSDALQIKIKEYRKTTEDLHKIPENNLYY